MNRTGCTLLVMLTLGLLVPQARADGGAVLAQGETVLYRVTLFGAPAPLRAGWNDLTVLVQDKATGEAVLDRAVKIDIRPQAEDQTASGENWVPPCCRLETTSTTEQTATHTAASNKILYAAPFLLREPGRWKASVRIDATQAVETTIDLLPPLAPWKTYWLYLAAPGMAGVFFLLQIRAKQRLQR
jgi:hypothetical protein